MDITVRWFFLPSSKMVMKVGCCRESDSSPCAQRIDEVDDDPKGYHPSSMTWYRLTVSLRMVWPKDAYICLRMPLENPVRVVAGDEMPCPGV